VISVLFAVWWLFYRYPYPMGFVFCMAGDQMGSFVAVAGSALLAMIAGVSFVVQQAVNADLRIALGSATWAGFVSYLGGTVCMLAVATISLDPAPSSAAAAQSNWWAWTGGFFGAVYIAVSILLVPKLGAGTFVALLVSGQMLASVLFDHYGMLGLAQRPADVSRLIGAVMLVLGVVLVRH